LAPKRIWLCKLPTPGTIAGRSSTITNAFFNAIIPIIKPTEQEELDAIRILGMQTGDIRCAYCGDPSTEWDHLHPIIEGREPTGYITEIANLVPACGKCNQSKGKSDWSKWIQGKARLSPKTRGKTGLDERIARLNDYARWKQPRRIKIEEIISEELRENHKANLDQVLALLKESQKLAKVMKAALDKEVMASKPDVG
jgi:5-methylcytosine-specific restriction endonuclease McrA